MMDYVGCLWNKRCFGCYEICFRIFDVDLFTDQKKKKFDVDLFIIYVTAVTE